MFTFICFVTVVILLLLLLWDTIKPKEYPPGPSWVPIVGNFLDFRKRLATIGYHHLVWKEFSEEYGSVVGLKMGRNFVVTVFGADAVKEILTREEFDGRPDGFFFRLRTFGKRLGIVFSDGQLWQKQRKFSLQHLRNFGFGRKEMEEKIVEETRDLITVFKKQCSEPIWMHTAFDVSVLNVLWAMMAGERFDINDERLRKLLNILGDAFKLTDMSGGILNQMPFVRFVAPETCGYNQLMDVLIRMWEFLQETITDHRKTLCSLHARDLIDAFLQNMNIKSDPSFTDDQLMSLCLDLFMAGSETTSNTLSFSVVYMLEFPEIQKKVQEEMDEIVGRNRWPTLQDRLKLKYTEAVLMEIQRRANIPPLGIAHRATRKTNIFQYAVPEDTIILTSLYSVHMDEKFWIDPLAFRPERFLDKNGNLSVNEKYFLPFGYALLHNFYLEKSFEGPSPQLEGVDGVTISPKPFKAKLIPRSD
ncbi:methyl farnesoate epoxidase-like isoform X2 [Zophobas morio]|uniref:methyl farnesoate epoxidase-like isoform X2 n=1 Tax=Zophobas morio TaxID=2755281 RepID=UPI0030838886